MNIKSKFYYDIMCLSEEVTGSCHLCIVKLPNGESIKFIVDCGLFQETEYYKYNLNLPFNPSQLSFALVTHNHTDHIGRLPLLVKHGFNANIYTTDITAELMRPSLEDTTSILGQVAKRNNTSPLYTEEHMQKALSLVKGVELLKEVKINDYISVKFLDNGHLIGASMILVKISYPGENSMFLLFTGDYSKKSSFFNVKKIPSYIFNLPITIVQEATYATTLINDVICTFEDNIMAATSKGKTVIIPVFSLGRSQEVLLKLKNMQLQGKLDTAIPIYLDGKLSIRYTNIFKNYCERFKDSAKNFIPDNFSFVDKTSRAALTQNTTDCKIILTSSGMGSYGPAPLYISSYISLENALIQFVGYPAKGTLSRSLKDAISSEFVKIGGLRKQKFCDIQYCTEFSSHAKLDEILEFLNQFTDIRFLLINHGELCCKENLAKEALLNLKVKDVAIEGRSTFYRVERYGIIKELSTKFL